MYLSYCLNKKYANKIYVPLLLAISTLLVSGCSNSGVKRGYLDSNNSSDLSANSTRSTNSSQACSNQYRVVSGDSLSLISARCNVKMSALANANNINKPYVIRVGQVLTIPGGVAGVSTGRTSQQAQGQVQARQHASPSKAEVDKSYQAANWQWPMQQKLEHRFLRDSAGVSGLEIDCLSGMPILAVADGEVVYVGSNILEFGLIVMLKHPSGHISVYAHNSQVHVKEGQTVKARQQISTSGSTGLTDRPKLYVEARYKGKKIDIQRLF